MSSRRIQTTLIQSTCLLLGALSASCAVGQAEENNPNGLRRRPEGGVVMDAAGGGGWRDPGTDNLPQGRCPANNVYIGRVRGRIVPSNAMPLSMDARALSFCGSVCISGTAAADGTIDSMVDTCYPRTEEYPRGGFIGIGAGPRVGIIMLDLRAATVTDGVYDIGTIPLPILDGANVSAVQDSPNAAVAVELRDPDGFTMSIAPRDVDYNFGVEAPEQFLRVKRVGVMALGDSPMYPLLAGAPRPSAMYVVGPMDTPLRAAATLVIPTQSDVRAGDEVDIMGVGNHRTQGILSPGQYGPVARARVDASGSSITLPNALRYLGWVGYRPADLAAPPPPPPPPAMDSGVVVDAGTIMLPPRPADSGVVAPPPPPPPPPPGPDRCNTSNRQCEVCTFRENCGYCADDGRCATGIGTGPSTGSCRNWQWTPDRCGGAPPPPPPPPPPPIADSGVIIGADVPNPPAPMCMGPVGNFGRTQNFNLAPPNSTACSNGQPFSVYGADFCAATATVVVYSAGWCGPCQEEAPIVEREITAPYRARGVRVLTVINENPDRSPATTNFCNQWRTRYGLTSTMLIDPSNSWPRSMQISAFPTIAVFDRTGRIRMVQAAPSLATVRATLDAILAGR